MVAAVIEDDQPAVRESGPSRAWAGQQRGLRARADEGLTQNSQIPHVLV